MHPHYYQIKAAVLQWQMAQQELQAAFAKAKAAFDAELVACALDPSKSYQLNEQSKDIVEASDERTAES